MTPDDMCPVHGHIAKALDDHEGRLRTIEHHGPHNIPDLENRVARLETAVERLSWRMGTWAAVGMMVGGVLIQAFTKYVLGW